MNGRKLFREYAQSKGKIAKEYIEIKSEMYDSDILITKDNSGNLEETSINYKDMVHWIISTMKNK